jgi:Zn-dependent protease/CBS domain-containing protein
MAMLPSGHRIRLGRIFGIPLEITASWILLSMLAVWTFWARYTTAFHHRTDGIAIVMAVVATVLLTGSILLHELAHGLVGRWRGLRVSAVTLYFFGGATTASDPTTPVDELLFTASGPMVNLVLALVFWGITGLADHGHASTIAQVTGEEAWLNLLLGIFNLVPAAPLDGGHVLESVAWRVTKDRARAVNVAARAGAGLGAALIGVGVLELLFVRGGLFDGLWLGLIGYVLLEGARSAGARAWVETALRGQQARVLLTDHAQPVTKDTSVRWLVYAEFLRHHVDAVPVEEDGRAVGVVLASDVMGPGATASSESTAADVMHPLDQLPTEPATADAIDVLRLLADHPLVVLVDDTGRLEGAVSQRQVGLVLDRLRALGTSPAPFAR